MAGKDKSDRLAAALKANLARRKAQTRARREAGGDAAGEPVAGGAPGQATVPPGEPAPRTDPEA